MGGSGLSGEFEEWRGSLGQLSDYFGYVSIEELFDFRENVGTPVC